MIKLVNVNKFFGNVHVLKDVNLEVAEGENWLSSGPPAPVKAPRCAV